MTLDDMLAREAIRHTMARYTLAGDRLRVEEFTAVFTEDAVLESEGVPPEDAFCYRGRDQISQWITRWTERTADPDAPTHRATFVRHHLATCLIELGDPGAATARTYWTAYTDIGPDHGGYYVDRFEKTASEWLIAHRRVRLDWRSPDSLFTTAIERSR